MSEEEKSIIDFLKKCKENKDKIIPLLQQSNEILLNYIDKSNNQLQQKENIIKEVRKEVKILESNCDISNYHAQKLYQTLDKEGVN